MKSTCTFFKLRSSLFLFIGCFISFIANAQSKDLVIIANNLENKIGLQASLPINIETAEVSYVDELFSKMLAAIEGKSAITNVHLFTPGDGTSLHLGNAIFDVSSLNENIGVLNRIADEVSSSDRPNLFIYGCHIAATPEGKAFLNALASKTGFNILGASDCNGGDDGEFEFDFSTSGVHITTTNFSH